MAKPKKQPPPDKKQQEAITRATSRVGERVARVTARLEKGEGHALHISPPHTDVQGWGNHLKDAFGTASTEFAAAEMDRLVNALGSAPKECALDAALACIGAAQPKDEIEAMLAVQMAVTHAHVMDFMGRAKRAKEIPQFESAGNMAVKLLRTFIAQAETLAKLRRGGQQTVRVEHVHVYPGGQAVVGNVTHQPNTGGGGGGEKENVGRPHAIGYSPGTPMQSPDKERRIVPTAGNGKRALPNARRCKG